MPLLCIKLQGNKVIDAYLIEDLDAHDNLVEQRGEPVKDYIFIPLAYGNPKHII